MAKLVGKQTHTLSVMSGQATKLVDKGSWKRFILMMHPTHKVVVEGTRNREMTSLKMTTPSTSRHVQRRKRQLRRRIW